MLRGLGPLMGLLAIGAPLFAEPLTAWHRAANATEQRLTTDSSRFFHPLVTLLSLAVAGAVSSHQAHAHPYTTLGWDAQTSLRGSIWMVRDRWMTDFRPSPHSLALISLLRC